MNESMWITKDGTQVAVSEMADKHLQRAIERIAHAVLSERMSLEESELAAKSLDVLRDEMRRRKLNIPWQYFAMTAELTTRRRLELMRMVLLP